MPGVGLQQTVIHTSSNLKRNKGKCKHDKQVTSFKKSLCIHREHPICRGCGLRKPLLQNEKLVSPRRK